MTNFYVTYKLPDKEKRDLFFQEIKASGMITNSRAEDGCIRYEFFYPAEADNCLFLWEQWVSRDAQKKHTQQPHFAALQKIKEKYDVDSDILIEDQSVGN